MKHVGGVDALAAAVRTDEASRQGLAAVMRKHLLGGEAAARAWERGGGAPAAADAGASPPPLLPTYLRGIPLQGVALDIFEVMCWCADEEIRGPHKHEPPSLFKVLFMYAGSDAVMAKRAERVFEPAAKALAEP